MTTKLESLQSPKFGVLSEAQMKTIRGGDTYRMVYSTTKNKISTDGGKTWQTCGDKDWYEQTLNDKGVVIGEEYCYTEDEC